MAKVHLLNVTVSNNPAPFFTSFQFEILFECLEELQDDLEFKIIYVGSAETIEFDQTLDQIVVDAVPKGQFKFMFQADPPDTSKIPADDAVGVTVVLITASYRDQEFVRVGYYVNNEYEDPELRDNPPPEPIFDKLIRTIATDQPRVTKFKINWDSSTANAEAGALPSTSSTANDAASMDPNQAIPQDTEMATDDNSQSNKTPFNQANNLINSQIQNGLNSNKFENKENINGQQNGKYFNADSKLNGFEVNNPIGNNQLFENSHDSVMN